MCTGELALEVIGKNGAALAEQAPRAEHGSEPEPIHQARVATRRLRAALRVFDGVLDPSAEGIRAELKWIAGLLGQVRDLDVQLRRLQDNASRLGVTQAVVPYGAWLGERRQHALEVCSEALHADRFARLVDSLKTGVTVSPEQDTDVEAYAPHQLKRAAKKLRKRASALDMSSPDAAFHQARIRAKRLRYTAEFFEPLCGKPGKKLIKRTTDLQDLLGDHQDGIVAGQLIHEAVETTAAAWPAEASLALGRILQWEAQHRIELREEFPDLYEDVELAWRKLGNAL